MIIFIFVPNDLTSIITFRRVIIFSSGKESYESTLIVA